MKNFQKHLFVLVCLIAINSWAFGQQQFGVKVSGGISRLYGALEDHNHPPGTMTTSFSPSGQAGLYYNFPVGKNSAIGAELLYSHVEGGQTYQWNFKDDNYTDVKSLESNGSDYTFEQISYLSLPVYYGYTFKRLTINAGFQISYAFSSAGHNESNYVIIIIDENDDLYKRGGGMNRELNALPIKDFDFGPRAGVIYRLTNRLSIEGMFYYGIQNINQITTSVEELKIQQMTLGIRYALWNKSEIQ
ncbi:MAG TPA: outer membrane beta-barrel protein [Prolixibacteraceae bacterium]|jgi:hypothetical protein